MSIWSQCGHCLIKILSYQWGGCLLSAPSLSSPT
nr:MAG TPA: hypothetical protein [Caudoviricetes sp.]